MIRVELSKEGKRQLENLRRQASAKDSEKILMVLLNSEGKSPPDIGKLLKRHPHTVRDWLKRFRQGGHEELKRKYSPGRPGEKRELIAEKLEEVLLCPPQNYGYGEAMWTVPLLVHYLATEHKIKASDDTVERALKKAGFSYKRPAKSVSGKAPGREEKIEAITRMIEEIRTVLQNPDWEVFALDESHFSTEPYLIKGWFKKRWPPSDTGFDEAGEAHLLWMLESKDTKILLEKVSRI